MVQRRLRRPDPDSLFATKSAKKIPYDFVLEALAARDPRTRPMFGATAVYVDDTIVFVLREKAGGQADNGVWMATTLEHHASLWPEFPEMRSISVFGDGKTGWQVLPAESDAFEESVLHACALVVAGDPRIGKVPKARVRPRARRAGVGEGGAGVGPPKKGKAKAPKRGKAAVAKGELAKKAAEKVVAKRAGHGVRRAR